MTSNGEVALVCMSVHNEFMIEKYRFTHSLHAFSARVTYHKCHCDGEVKDWEDRERVQRHKRLLTAQKIDERRQDNGDRRQFVC